MTRSVRHVRRRAPIQLLAAAAVASLAIAGCGSSKSASSSGSSTTTPSSAAQTTSSSAADAAAIASNTVMTATVPGVGTVLVNGSGRTFYVLSSEHGAQHFTCTDDNHCTDLWPDTGGLPAGTMHGIAGTGANASLLGTYTSASGDHYLTYGGWPLYTYTGDTGPGTAKGQGITSFGGTWWTIDAAGNPVTKTT